MVSVTSTRCSPRSSPTLPRRRPARLALALERLHLGGVATNRDFLAATLRHPAFLAGDTTTDFIDRVAGDHAGAPRGRGRPLRHPGRPLAAGREPGTGRCARAVPSGWRIGRLPAQRVSLAHGDDVIDVHYQSPRMACSPWATADGGTAHIHRWSCSEIDVEIEGRRTTAQITRAGDRLHVQTVRGTITFGVVPRFVVPAAAPSGGLMAPMPGVVLDVRCAPGDQAEAGQILVVLEAMKMEHVVRAPADGVVADVRVAMWDTSRTGRSCSCSSRPTAPNALTASSPRRRGRPVSALIRIANCSGFYGDRLSAAREMVEGGPIDVLTGDWLAEPRC